MNAHGEIREVVDNIVDAGANNDVDMNAAENVQSKATENALNDASTLTVEDADKDVGQSIRELTDPYSILAKEVAPGQELSPIPPTEQAIS